jgi:ERCC4-related helicase
VLKDINPRIYQQTIFNSAAKKNCLVVLPTGLGKTMIALLLAAHRLKLYPTSKILILAPTKPLVEQHLTTFKKHFDLSEEEIVLFTGLIKPEKRAELWLKAKIVISTPQGIENDVVAGRISLKETSLLVIDEAHRAVKDYAYTFIAKQFEKKSDHSRILGLTASPGSDLQKIDAVCKNLFIEDIEIRTEDEPDVKPYIQEVDVEWVEVDFPDELNEIKQLLEFCQKRKLIEVKNMGLLPGSINNYSQTTFLQLQAEFRSKISSGEKDFSVLRSISLIAEVMKVQHALELVESQGLDSLEKYFQRLEHQARTTTTKAVKNLLADQDFISARLKARSLVEKGVEHPKLAKLKEIIQKKISEDKNIKIIIFSQYRSSSAKIRDILNELDVSNKMFIGQSSKEEKGLTQKQQKEIIEDFSQGKFNCLISTSVGEEGLDIPQVDLVIFYEPVPSAIRSIQRRGRTGRLEKGKVMILLTKKTRDEAYRWASFHKEKRMYRDLEKIKKQFFQYDRKSESKEQNLNSFIEDSQTEIIVDHREKGSPVIKCLIDLGIKLSLKALESGDFIIGSEIVIEYKTKKDFVDSIIDGRLLQQLRPLSKNLKPMLIIEGEADIYSQRNIHSNAIRGMLAVIALSYRIPIIYTKNAQDTAQLLQLIANKNNDQSKKEFQQHSLKPVSMKDQQEYVISSLPGIGPSLAKKLLESFGSVKKVINASEDNLKKVDLLGPKKADNIKNIVESDYKK